MSDPQRVARAVVEMARDGQFAGIAKLFAPPLAAVVSTNALKEVWATEIAKIGSISAVGEVTSETMPAGLVRVSVPLTGERGTLTVFMSVDDEGAVHGLRFATAGVSWTSPPYAAPTTFDEHDVTLGSGALVVQGTLSMPRGTATVPGVVLLSGGGPFDRDETAGSNKPLKDLAWGLASRGVAIARFDREIALGRALDARRLCGENTRVHDDRRLRAARSCRGAFVTGHATCRSGSRLRPRSQHGR